MSSTHNAGSHQAVFGQPLETITKAQQARGAKSDVPQVITEIILWLESHQGIPCIALRISHNTFRECFS
jgi:hypothetical protein